MIPLSDEMWAVVQHLFEEPTSTRAGRPRRDARQLLNGVLWVVLNEEKWHHLPAFYPPSQTCYARWLQWNRSGVMAEVFTLLKLGELTRRAA